MKVYVDLTFLENLLLADEQTDRHFYIKKLLSSQQSSVEVIIDVDFEEVYNNPDKRDTRTLLRQIAQNINAFDPTFLVECQTQSFHESGEPKLFFVDGVSLFINKQFGYLQVSTVNLAESDFLFHAEEIRIDNKQQDWSSLKNFKHPCNALIVTDNYLFTDKDAYLENMKSICESLMPDSLSNDFSFDVTLIGHDAKNDFRPLQDQYGTLLNYFRAKFSYPVNLTIIRETYHDRYIFTNYYRIASGNGFALFKGRKIIPGKQTTIHCKSLAYEGRLSSTHQTRNDELLMCRKINQAERVKERLAGNQVNRLFV